MKFSDETLLAYLEGSLDEDQCRAIEAAVEEDVTLEERLMSLDPFAPVVQQVFEGLPADTPHVDLPEMVAASPVRSSGGYLRLIGVAAATAIAAVALTFWATRPVEPGWAEQAAIYQSLYVPETIASLNSSPQSLDAQFEMAEEKLGRSLNRDALEALPGLELKRAQILSFKGKPLVQIVFADAQGEPFAFCVIRQGPAAPNKDVKQAVLSGLATATWAQDGYGYMLLGSNPQTNLDGELGVLRETFSG